MSKYIHIFSISQILSSHLPQTVHLPIFQLVHTQQSSLKLQLGLDFQIAKQHHINLICISRLYSHSTLLSLTLQLLTIPTWTHNLRILSKHLITLPISTCTLNLNTHKLSIKHTKKKICNTLGWDSD